MVLIMKKYHVYSTVFALFFSFALVAQEVTLKTPDMVVEPGTNIHLDIQVENFNLITGVQFSLNWNPDVLEYIGVDNFGLPNMSTEGNFGTTEVEAGKLRFAWYQLELTGITLADMEAVFSVWFKVIGAPNAAADLLITNSPIVVEVVGTQGMLPFNIQNGNITVAGPNASTETFTTDFVLFQNSPNPFTSITYINFDLNKSTLAHLSIYDNAGRVVYKNSEFYSSGSHAIPIRRDLFQSAGTYLYSLRTDQGTATRQMIVQ
ncbi:MAG: T9SS type A sorting domain-containing protein [Saprospiraceae bacterium]|nr:MAG: T9SS type A sorting domain-containing protein [Saprospiraceae bacterium]